MAAQAKQAAMHTEMMPRMALRRLLLSGSNRQNWQVDISVSPAKQTLCRREMQVRRSASYVKTTGKAQGNDMTNKSLLKATLTATALLAASGYTVMAQAHCIGTLGNFGASSIAAVHPSAFQSDTYLVVCPASTMSMKGKISLGSGTGPVSMEIGKGGYAHTSITDTVALAGTQCNGLSNESIGSTAAEIAAATSITPVNGGAGQYTLTVSKDSAASANYAAEFHCMAGLNGTGVELAPVSQSSLTLIPPNPAFNGLLVDRLAEVDRIMNH